MPQKMTIEAYIYWFKLQVPRRLDEWAKTAVREVAEAAAERARGKLGVYQPAVAEWPAWEELSPATDNTTPLLREGTLRDSISAIPPEKGAQGNYLGGIQSTDEFAAFHELGTSNEPPRPFLGPAVYETLVEATKVLGYGATDAVNPNATPRITKLKLV